MGVDFKYCPMCGSQRLVPRNETLLVCEACNYHNHINPIVAVAAFLLDPQGRMLWLRRGKEPSKGKLGPPGGFVDLAENAEEALRREVKEEANLELDNVGYFCSFPNEYPYRGRIIPTVDFFYTAQVRSWNALKGQEGEVAGFVFARLDELNPEDLAFTSVANAFRLFREKRA